MTVQPDLAAGAGRDGQAMLRLADQHEAHAIALSEAFDRGSVTKAAAHFTVAEALRQRARWAK